MAGIPASTISPGMTMPADHRKDHIRTGRCWTI
jgi:hypothetical protein